MSDEKTIDLLNDVLDFPLLPDNIQKTLYRMEEERNKYKKELEKLRKAVWKLDLSDKYNLEQALNNNNERVSVTRSADIWQEIDKQMNDWYPDKKEK